MENQFVLTAPRDGVRVCSYRTDRFKTGILAVHMVLPLEGNVAENALLPYLLASSCKEYPNLLALNRKLASLYGAELSPSVSKMGENLILRLSMTQIADRFALGGERISLESAELLFSALFRPNVQDGAFLEEDVERERRMMLERMEAQKNNKRSYALIEANKHMCKGEAYALSALGTEEEVRALSGEQLYTAYQSMLKKACWQLHITGDLNPEGVTELFLGNLDAIEDRTPVKGTTVVLPAAEETIRAVETQDIQQGKLVLGFRCGMTEPNENYAALRVMADLFGGGTYSRLFMNVREKQSLCYYCSARYIGTKGVLFVQSGIEMENAEKAETEILRQLQEMKDGGVTEEDLNKSLTSLRDNFMSVFDTPEELDGWFYSQVADEEFETPEELVDRLSQVTVPEVIKAANDLSLNVVYLLKGEDTNG